MKDEGWKRQEDAAAREGSLWSDRAAALRAVAKATESIRADLEKKKIDIPTDLRQRIEAALKADDSMSWDASIWEVAADCQL